MVAVYFLDVDDFAGIIAVGRQCPGVTEERVGGYVRLSTSGELSIDRRATGARQAVWYSAVAGVTEGRVRQFDKDRLLVAPVDVRAAAT